MACNCNDLSSSLTAINNKIDALREENASLKAQIAQKPDNSFLNKALGTFKDALTGNLNNLSSRMNAVEDVVSAPTDFLKDALEGLFGRSSRPLDQSDLAELNRRINKINDRFKDFQTKENANAMQKIIDRLDNELKSTERKLAEEIRNRQKETAEAIKLARRAEELSQKASEKVDKVRRDLGEKIDDVSKDLSAFKKTVDDKIENKIAPVRNSLNAFKAKVEASLAAINGKIAGLVASNKLLYGLVTAAGKTAAAALATATAAFGLAKSAMGVAVGAAAGVAGLLINVTALVVQMNQLRRVDAELRGAIAQGQQDHLQNLSAIAGLAIRMRQLEALAQSFRGVDITAFNSAINKLNADLSSLGRNFTTQIDGLRQADKLFATKQDLAGLKQALLTGAIATVGGLAASALATAAIAKLTAGAANTTANSALRLAQQRPAPVNQTIYIDRTRTINQTQIIRQQTTIDRTRTINQTQVIDRTQTIKQTDPRLSGRVSALERSQSALSARVSSLQNFFSRQVTNIRNTTTNVTNNIMDSALLQKIFNQTKQNNLAINLASNKVTSNGIAINNTSNQVLNNGVAINNTLGAVRGLGPLMLASVSAANGAKQKAEVVDNKIGVFPTTTTVRVAGSATGQTQDIELQSLSQATTQAITSANNAEANLGIPFKTPTTLINETVNPAITHLDFASIISWIIYQMDALIGEFPIKLEIEDSDLMKTGDQTLKLEFPNLAEALAEMMGLAINSKAVTEANLDASMRSLMESGSGRKQAITNHALLEAIQDYLGFSSRQKIIEVPFTYNPIDAVKNDKIGDALQSSIQKVKVEENTDPDTLEKQLKILREAAAITKTIHFKKLSPNSVDQWKAEMKASRDQTSKKDPDQEKDDFDQFLDNVEQGWTNQTGDDPTAPYDRNFEERPRIRRLNQGDETNG